MINTLWLTSLHEAAHLTSAHALGGRVEGAKLGGQGSGVALFTGLSGGNEAIATAAGYEAERQLADVPPPALPDVAPAEKALTPDVIRSFAYETTGTAPRDAMADDTSIAVWAVVGHVYEGAARWEERIFFAHEMARRIVKANRNKIIEVAAALYLRGELGHDELAELLPPLAPQETDSQSAAVCAADVPVSTMEV